MKFRSHIILRLLVPLTIGMVILGALTVTVIFLLSPGWIKTVEDVILTNALAGFSASAVAEAQNVDEIFRSHIVDAKIVGEYVRQSFGLPGAKFPLTTVKPYQSYFAAQLDNPPIDPPQPPAVNPPLYSAYFNPNIITTSQLNSLSNATSPTPSVFSTQLDNPLRAVQLNHATVEAVQVGFEDNGWRIYPLVYNITRYDPRRVSVCNSVASGGLTVPSSLDGTLGYYVQCRAWYIQAKAAGEASKTDSLATSLGPAILSNPYRSQASTDKILVTSAQAFYDANGMRGAVGVQVNIQSLTSRLSGITVLQNGYLFVINANGDIVIYPSNRTSIDIYAKLTSIASVEFSGDSDLASTFLSLVKQSASSPKAPSYNFYKSRGGDQWTLAAASVESTNYYVVVVVPNSDITNLSTQMHTSTFRFALVALIIALVTIVLASGLSLIYTSALARRVLKPVEEMMVWLKRIQGGDLEEEVSGGEARAIPVAREVTDIVENFKYLLVAMRFGNEDYYRGDLRKALNNYEEAERMMNSLNNRHGLGVCYNNKGNVLKQLEAPSITNASASYTKAIGIAQELLANTHDPAQRTKIIIAIASRTANLGVLHKDRYPFNIAAINGFTTPVAFNDIQREAERLLMTALDMHRSVDNLEGIAQVSGNLGQLHLSAGHITEAAELIRDAFDVVKDRGDEVAKQYACMNMGLLANALGRPMEAVTWYTYVLQRYNVVVASVQRTCCREIVRLCEETDLERGLNMPALGRAVRDFARPIFGDLGDVSSGAFVKPKDIHFVLDCSGSMSGARSRACTASIKSIIHTDCTPHDRVAFTTFTERVRPVFDLRATDIPEAVQNLCLLIDTHSRCDGQTAFYDAVLHGVQSYLLPGARQPGREVWIVALTDGEDNRSNPMSFNTAINLLKTYEDIGLIIITVGPLKNESDIRRLTGAAKKGMLIKSGLNEADIKEAFGRAATMIVQGSVNVESFI